MKELARVPNRPDNVGTPSRFRGLHVSESPSWRIALAVVGLAIFVLAWDAYAFWVDNPVIVAPPLSVFGALSALFQNQIPKALSGENLYIDLLATLELIAVGFAISLVGIPVGFLMGRWRTAEALIDPWINALYAIPMVAIAPIIYLLAGGSFLADLVIVFLMTFFTITLNTFHGVRYVSNAYAEVGKSFGASEGQFTRHILLPASLPDIVSGMRLGLGRAVLASIVAEVLLSHDGLGNLMFAFQQFGRTSFMMAVVMIIAVVGILFLNTPRLVEQRLFRWKAGERLSRSL
jgi:NitT/TauT family transport system permease protein